MLDLTNITSDDLSSVEALCEADIRRAHAIATLTGSYLRVWCRQHKVRMPKIWPREFLLELGGLMELHLWQCSGDMPNELADFANADELFDELWGRFFAGEIADHIPDGKTISGLQLALDRAWQESSHWDAIGSIGIPIRASRADRECAAELYDRLAELLWNNRHVVLQCGSEWARESRIGV